MRRDFDYVTMGDYQRDMKESSDHAGREINHVRERAMRAEKMLALVVLAAGKVTITDRELSDIRPIELVQWRNDAEMAYTLEAKRS